MDVLARVVSATDWQAWRDIRLRALLDSPGAFGSTWGRERGFAEREWRGRLAEADAVSVLAESVQRPVGMGAAYRDRPDLLHVVAMWVDPAFRGRGVGHEVLRVLEEEATARGFGLHLDVALANAAARRSYERYGFVATGETRPLREGSDQRVERMVLQRQPPIASP